MHKQTPQSCTQLSTFILDRAILQEKRKCDWTI